MRKSVVFFKYRLNLPLVAGGGFDVYAYTVKILEMGKPIYFINENNSVCILGYVTLKPNKQLFIIRPEYIKDLFELIAEIRSDYDEITIVTDEKNIIRQYINKVKRASYFVTPIISLEQGMNQVIENFSPRRKQVLKMAKREAFEVVSEKTDENICDFANLYCSEKGQYEEEQCTEQQFVKLLQLDCYKLYLCKYQGTIAAGTIVMDYGDTAEERFIVTNSDLKKMNGSTFLKEYCLNLYSSLSSIKYYDLGGYTCMQEKGSKLSGINFFKKSFGGELKKYYNFSF